MLRLDDLKLKIQAVEAELRQQVFVDVYVCTQNSRPLHVALTQRLMDKCRKGRVWKSKAFLTALKNAEYGFDEMSSRSLGGRDGVFLLDRDFRPPNSMMTKLFDQYLDKTGSGAELIARYFGTTADRLRPVRVVSHHMRLLGVLWQNTAADWIILVDFDTE